jgi:hypothetical protein
MTNMFFYRQILQSTILNVTFDLLNKTSPNSSSHSKTTFELLNKTSPNFQKNQKIDTFADHLFGAIYLYWIRSQMMEPEIWRELSKKVSSLVNWKANIVQWKVSFMTSFSQIFFFFRKK